MPPKIELAFNKPFVVIVRTEQTALRLLNNATEIGMSPTLLEPGRNRSTIGTKLPVGKGNLGLLITGPNEIEVVPALLQSTATELQGERDIVAGEALAQEGNVLFAHATHMLREAQSLTALGSTRLRQARNYRAMTARIHLPQKNRQ